jgi:hypothetical protein
MRITLIAITLLSGAAYLALSEVARADSEACSLATSAAAAPAGVRLLAGQDPGDELRVECREGDLVAITAALSQGAVAQARLFWNAPAEAPVRVTPVDSEAVDWLSAHRVAAQRGGQILSLRWQAPAGDPAGTLRSANVRVGDRVVEVHLEVVSTDNLFRDGFDVDPVIGQFSMVVHTP